MRLNLNTLSQDLENHGYVKDFFPFTDAELQLFELASDKIKDLSLEERKNVFSAHSELRLIIDTKLSALKSNYRTSNYCFYLEKSTERNWPLALHQDLNFPNYLENKDDIDLQKHACWFRINLDASNHESGALKIIPKSHLCSTKSEAVFLNNLAGEVILFTPLLFHGSNKMTKNHKRRVFQVLCMKTNT